MKEHESMHTGISESNSTEIFEELDDDVNAGIWMRNLFKDTSEMKRGIGSYKLNGSLFWVGGDDIYQKSEISQYVR